MTVVWIIRVLSVSLGSTIVLEEAFGWILGVRGRWDRRLIALVNVLTNPAVVFLYYCNEWYGGWNRAVVTMAVEGAAVAAEALCYRAAARKIRHPWLFAAGANLFSFTAGAVLSVLL